MEIFEAQSAVSHPDMDWQLWLSGLLNTFGVRSHDDAPEFLYLLVDGRASPGTDKLLEQVPNLQFASLWEGSAIESYADIAPYLIAIDRRELENESSLQRRLARRFWREVSESYALTWLWSPYALDELEAHYRRFAMYELPDRRAFYLHFYDNRVLARLKHVWSDAEARQFIAPCSEIWYRDRSLADVTWRNAASPDCPALQERLSLTERQHQRLLELGYADKIALQLRDTCGAALDHVSAHDLQQKVSEQLERAAMYRIGGEGDLQRYISMGVLVGARFDEHPAVQALLQRVARGELALTDALAQIGEDVWNAIENTRDDAHKGAA
ncbi:DUF4123 domain-containing protein [Ralstonia sp. UBA689]|uniref:DUF4123 domain-containing protein n=1 Tax=Ralstonia sp. UBA689 TaxID=1947373 RepID=UPI0025CBFCDD|nr:DUF4123 domain-containing protein [Ralstonia sp. UBA689]